MKFWKISCPTFQPSCFKGYVGFIILVGIDYNKLFFLISSSSHAANSVSHKGRDMGIKAVLNIINALNITVWNMQSIEKTTRAIAGHWLNEKWRDGELKSNMSMTSIGGS